MQSSCTKRMKAGMVWREHESYGREQILITDKYIWKYPICVISKQNSVQYLNVVVDSLYWGEASFCLRGKADGELEQTGQLREKDNRLSNCY